tara:strand:+ start:6424 stop:6759 length:336 start_codon:yes stop_codon:yes gene_type:complete
LLVAPTQQILVFLLASAVGCFKPDVPLPIYLGSLPIHLGPIPVDLFQPPIPRTLLLIALAGVLILLDLIIERPLRPSGLKFCAVPGGSGLLMSAEIRHPACGQGGQHPLCK